MPSRATKPTVRSSLSSRRTARSNDHAERDRSSFLRGRRQPPNRGPERGPLFFTRLRYTRAGPRNRSEPLYPAKQKQDEQNRQHQPEQAARSVAPAPAVRPSWNRANQYQDDDDQQYGSQCHFIFPWIGELPHYSVSLLSRLGWASVRYSTLAAARRAVDALAMLARDRCVNVQMHRGVFPKLGSVHQPREMAMFSLEMLASPFPALLLVSHQRDAADESGSGGVVRSVPGNLETSP